MKVTTTLCFSIFLFTHRWKQKDRPLLSFRLSCLVFSLLFCTKDAFRIPLFWIQDDTLGKCVCVCGCNVWIDVGFPLLLGMPHSPSLVYCISPEAGAAFPDKPKYDIVGHLIYLSHIKWYPSNSHGITIFLSQTRKCHVSNIYIYPDPTIFHLLDYSHHCRNSNR